VTVGAFCPVSKAGSNTVGGFSVGGTPACGAIALFVMVFRPVTGSVTMFSRLCTIQTFKISPMGEQILSRSFVVCSTVMNASSARLVNVGSRRGKLPRGSLKSHGLATRCEGLKNSRQTLPPRSKGKLDEFRQSLAEPSVRFVV
jgi:hypothetical protein